MIKDIIKKLGLKHQLILISLLAIIIAFILTIIVLPKLMIPFYEKNIYEVLEQPTNFINPDVENNSENVAFIINDNIDRALVSKNFHRIIGQYDASLILSKANKDHGKFVLNNETFYYYKVNFGNYITTTFMNDTYIKTQQQNLNQIIIPIMVFTLIITLSILIIYSNYLVKKISKIKEKLGNFNNSEYDHTNLFDVNDEFNSLNKLIEKLRIELLQKEEYKNNMFQSISHELKTPIMVISSHIEAINDKVMESDKAMPIIQEECKKLEAYVTSLLKLNKLAFLKENKKLKFHNTDIKPIIKKSIDKFSVMRPDVEFVTNFNSDKSVLGDDDSWQLIVDNILSNFMRYANNKIEININEDKITFYNDGEKIDKIMIDNIFKPYEKGNKGNTGLGLSIVYMTLDLIGYSISAKNEENGVLFTISKIKR